MLTTSPVTIPSPSSGPAPSATTASPVLIPIRTCSESAGSSAVQLLDCLQDAQAGADGALRVVLVRDRGAEDGHDRVADELLDRASVALDLLPQPGVVGADAGADVLGVGRFGGGGEADEVAEEDGDDLALLLEEGAGCSVSGARRSRRMEARPEVPSRRRDRSPRGESTAAVSRLGRGGASPASFGHASRRNSSPRGPRCDPTPGRC